MPGYICTVTSLASARIPSSLSVRLMLFLLMTARSYAP
ncbi:hypothetical protein PsAD37_02298 [Pseudovibrio sp. Ad37]|nr:hypothetical protein PsAD37_02298 [Pseudovibrio sp. Ad37]